MITNKQINKNAKSNLAKLLATENISVEHKKVRTAYFDLKNRLLVVPIFKDMNKDILDLLLSHEIGHALFTDMNEWRIAVEEEKIPHSFLNVIEDARIEKLVKRKYPGLSQTFIRGYRDLIASNFFKTKDRNLDDMLLIDRLNMHFKSSFVESDIYFTEPELEIVDRMKNLETFDDVKKLAQELADYSNEEAETKQMNDIDEFSDDGEFDFDSEDSDEEGDSDYAEKENKEEENENEGNSETDTTSSESDNDKEEKQKEEVKDTGHNAGTQSDTITDESIPQEPNQVQPETDNAWQETSKELLDSKCKDNEYLNIHEYKNLKDYVVDYKEVLNDFRFSRIGHFKKSHMTYKTVYSKLLTDYKKFIKNQNKAVNYMVKEFEMKKAAHAYSRSKQDKSGVIDPLKLHGYKYNDDIFKRLTLLPDGKNHGLMMFIDWSGSMGDKISATIEQLMNLTMFCKKVQIPFEVYAFSNNTSYRSDNNYSDKVSYPEPTYENNDVSVDTHMILFNFVSSRMNATEYDQGMTNLYYLGIKHESERNYYRQRNMSYINGQRIEDEWKYHLHGMPRGMNLSSTPLNDCIMAAMKMVPAFQKKYNIDKMNTVFLTDGQSDGNERKAIIDSEEIKKLISGDNHYGDRNDTPTLKNKYLSSDTNHILVDKQTKKQTLLPTYGREGLTDALLEALKERTHSKVIGFFIESRKRISLQTLDQYFPQSNHYADKKKTFNRQIVMAEFRKNKCLVVKDNTGYDELYLLAADNMKVTDELMATPSENAKKGELKRLFTSTLKSNRQSRVVLNKFISQVA
jgi:hypothetical protein